MVRVQTFDKAGDPQRDAYGLVVRRCAVLTLVDAVSGAYSARVTTVDTVWNELTVLKADGGLGVALLATNGPAGCSAEVDVNAEVQPGDTVYAVGIRQLDTGVVRAVRLSTDGAATCIEFTMFVKIPKGRPLVDWTGNLVGITTVRNSDHEDVDERLYTAVSSRSLASFLLRPDSPRVLRRARSRTWDGVALRWALYAFAGFSVLCGIGFIVVWIVSFVESLRESRWRV